jgi:hypothetical protein
MAAAWWWQECAILSSLQSDHWSSMCSCFCMEEVTNSNSNLSQVKAEAGGRTLSPFGGRSRKVRRPGVTDLAMLWCICDKDWHLPASQTYVIFQARFASRNSVYSSPTFPPHSKPSISPASAASAGLPQRPPHTPFLPRPHGFRPPEGPRRGAAEWRPRPAAARGGRARRRSVAVRCAALLFPSHSDCERVGRPRPFLSQFLCALPNTEDVTFSHIMGTVKGREAFYGVYRLAGTAWRYKVGAGWVFLDGSAGCGVWLRGVPLPVANNTPKAPSFKKDCVDRLYPRRQHGGAAARPGDQGASACVVHHAVALQLSEERGLVAHPRAQARRLVRSSQTLPPPPPTHKLHNQIPCNPNRCRRSTCCATTSPR